MRDFAFLLLKDQSNAKEDVGGTIDSVVIRIFADLVWKKLKIFFMPFTILGACYYIFSLSILGRYNVKKNYFSLA